jgi:hypothetical protein
MKEEMKEKLIEYIKNPAKEAYTRESIALKLEKSVSKTIEESKLEDMNAYFKKEDELFKKAISSFYKELTDPEIIELSRKLRKIAECVL